MAVPYNAPSRVRRRRTSALERVEKNIKAYTGTPDKESKLEAASIVANNTKVNLNGSR